MSPEPKLLLIRIYGDKILRQKAREVSATDEDLPDFAADLTRTMYERDGVGLAAPQVGISKRVIVVDPHWSQDGLTREPVVMLNPVIEWSSGETETEEGCISLPGIFANVTRPSDISVTFQDLRGDKQTLRLSGYPSVVVQHEIDHLDGILFIDRLGTIARLKLKLKLKELQKTAVDGVNIREQA